MGQDSTYHLWFMHEDENYLREVLDFISNGVKECEQAEKKSVPYDDFFKGKGVKIPKSGWNKKTRLEAREFNFFREFELGKIEPYEYSKMSFSEALRSRSKPCLPVYEDDLKKCPKGYRFELVHETTERSNVWISSGYQSDEDDEVSVMSFLLEKFPEVIVRGWFRASYAFTAFGKVSNDSRDWLYGVDRYWGQVCQPRDGQCILTIEQAFDAFKSDGLIQVWFTNHLSDEIDEKLGKLLHKKLKPYDVPIDANGKFKLSEGFLQSLDPDEGGSWVRETDESFLRLTALEELSDAAAESLAKSECGLVLDVLKTLSDAAAESLSKHEGELLFYGLNNLSDAAAESLSRFKGRLTIFSLSGLTSLSDAVAEKLSQNFAHEMYLHDLSELSDAAAESLSKYEGVLSLYGLTKLSDAAAKSLAKMDPDNLELTEELEEQVAQYR